MVKQIIKAIFTKPLTIIKGTYYNIFNKHQDLATKRLKICVQCSHAIMFKNQAICDKCGCILESKTRLENEQCDKWL